MLDLSLIQDTVVSSVEGYWGLANDAEEKYLKVTVESNKRSLL